MGGTVKGLILKGIGGFYYVKTADGVLECKPKGLFRKQGVTPLAGDRVEVECGATNVISEIFERKNSFQRPPLANINRMFLVVSSVEPSPNYLVLDKMCAIICKKGISPVIVLTKTDLASCGELRETYTVAGVEVLDCSQDNSDGLVTLKEMLGGGINAFAGNSGVGKSTLINRLLPELDLATDEISERLGRGKHTTRVVELYPFENGYVADTPGFSAVDIERAEVITKDELPYCFPEIRRHLGGCRFADCSHTKEAGCAVLDALDRGEIPRRRFDNYLTLYEAAKQLKDW